ncbi:MAG: MBOAT family O-acyltransferase, partial [Anaerolineales bacterium]
QASIAWAAALVVLLFAVKIPGSLGTVEWLGFSYVVLRLLSMLADFRSGQLPAMNATETLIYALFPASWLAGPIDRAPHFMSELRDATSAHSERLMTGGKRFIVGAFKKFVIADTLALAALSPALAGDIDSASGAWLAAYLYALRIFFDFSGYSDMAIGAGILAGIKLPENFNQPYLRPSLALFWQNWHMSLTGWFRAYVFMPLSRWLLRRPVNLPENLIAQIVTMLLIGAWHGLTANFLIWGLWHAVGLVAQRALSQRTRPQARRWNANPWRRRVLYVFGVFVTFHYVLIGWVFFALASPAESLRILGVMFGV